MKIENLIKKIQSVLTPNDLKPKYRTINKTNPMYGHCYVATEALYHLIKNYKEYCDFKPYRGKDDNGINHW